MTPTPFETYYAALFAALASLVPATQRDFMGGVTSGAETLAAGQLRTAGRKLLHWNDVPLELRPCAFQEQLGETHERRRGLPPKVTLNANWWVYVQTLAQQDAAAVPAQAINATLEAIRAALAVDDFTNNVCTLGGVVSHAWIEGTVEITEGVMDDMAVVTVPVHVLVP